MSTVSHAHDDSFTPHPFLHRLATLPSGTAVYNPATGKTTASRGERIVLISSVLNDQAMWEQASGHRYAAVESLVLLSGQGKQHRPRLLRYRRGMTNTRPARQLYGYRIVCSCGHDQRVNGTQSEARKQLQDHLMGEAQAEILASFQGQPAAPAAS